MAPKVKANIETSLLGRVARPTAQYPHAWPWHARFKATLEDTLKAENRVPGPPGLFLYGELVYGTHHKAMLEDRATVVAVRGTADGVKLTLENKDGDMGECFAANVALVPKEAS